MKKSKNGASRVKSARPKPARTPAAPPAAVGGDSAATWVPLTVVSPWSGNPRKNDSNAQNVARLIIEFGFGSPVLARSDNAEIIAGHTRLKAAKLLPGLWAKGDPEHGSWSADAKRVAGGEIPVRYMALNEARAHLFALADNRSSELSPWDSPLLRDVMGNYEIDDLRLAGWNDAALDKLMSEVLKGDATAGGTAEDWQGMPEFNQPSKAAFRSIIVHFAQQSDVDDFAKLIAQNVSEKTKYVWYPVHAGKEFVADKHYVSGGPDGTS